MKSFKETLYKNLDIQPDVLGGSVIEVRGGISMLVRGCEKILEYGSEKMSLRLSDGTLSVTGEELICTSYYGSAVGIEGKIKRISFEEET